jgi:hypothetical protein
MLVREATATHKITNGQKNSFLRLEINYHNGWTEKYNLVYYICDNFL